MTPLETTTNTAGPPIPVGYGPAQVAVSPDGAVLFVADDFPPMGSVHAIATASNTLVATIPVVRASNLGGAGLQGIAVTPNGAMVYAAWPENGTVEVVATATNAFVASIPVGMAPYRLAITPDGETVYVTGLISDDRLAVISTASNTVAGTVRVPGASGIAVAPNGKHVYVTQSGPHLGALAVIDTAKNAVVATIPVGSWPDGVAVSPDGATAYVSRDDNHVSVVSTASDRVVATIRLSGRPDGIAFSPDGKTAYVTNLDRDTVVPIATATHRVGAEIPAGEWPRMIAVVPNQPPRAAFAATTAGPTATFDASASADPDGTIRRFVWNFGDGTRTTTSSPTASHTYGAGGSYRVTLRLTDNEGCSTRLVFTGQTASCNGSAVATTTRTVPVTAGQPSAPAITRLAATRRCVLNATLIAPRPGKDGLAFSFSLSQDATLRYEIRAGPGPRDGRSARAGAGQFRALTTAPGTPLARRSPESNR